MKRTLDWAGTGYSPGQHRHQRVIEGRDVSDSFTFNARALGIVEPVVYSSLVRPEIFMEHLPCAAP